MTLTYGSKMMGNRLVNLLVVGFVLLAITQGVLFGILCSHLRMHDYVEGTLYAQQEE